MKRLKLAVLSLFALGRSGFCTANSAAGDIAEMKEQLARQDEEIARLRAAQSAPAPEPETFNATAAMAKGAGVPLSDVTWRIQAGLSPEQAVEAAGMQLASDAAAKALKEAAGKKEAK